MISDETLSAAAAESQEAFVGSFEADYDAACQHEFSAKFERKIRRLVRRAKHPVLYRTVRRAAAVLLAILIAGSVWLAADTGARAAFFGWVKEIYEECFVYKSSEGVGAEPKRENYEPKWIPEGYTKIEEIDIGGFISIFYLNDQNQYLKLHYVYKPQDVSIFVEMAQGELSECYVCGYKADLILFSDRNVGNTIMWSDENGCAYYISAFLDKDGLIKIAESIYD